MGLPRPALSCVPACHVPHLLRSAPTSFPPRPPAWRGGWLLLLSLLASLTGSVRASPDEHDHDRAREAVASGQVLPLQRVLEQIERERPGHQVLDVELEPKHGRWIYEIRLLQPGGRLIKLRLDARTGQPLRRDERDPPHPHESRR